MRSLMAAIVGAPAWLVQGTDRRSAGRHHRESRTVPQHAVPAWPECGGTHSGPGRTDPCGARRRLQVALVPAPLPDRTAADAADRADDGVSRAARRGYADRPEHS